MSTEAGCSRSGTAQARSRSAARAAAAEYDSVGRLRSVAQVPLKYVVDESRTDSKFRVYRSPLGAPDFGINRWPDSEGVTRFLILPVDADIPFQYRPDRQVAEKYGLFTPSENYRYVFFSPSSVHSSEQWGEGLLSGRLATNSQHPDSLRIFKAFKTTIRNEFERIGVCYVGAEAAQRLDSGGRLTDDLRRPHEFDLRRVGVVATKGASTR
jgi:hypothetical protein